MQNYTEDRIYKKEKIISNTEASENLDIETIQSPKQSFKKYKAESKEKPSAKAQKVQNSANNTAETIADKPSRSNSLLSLSSEKSFITSGLDFLWKAITFSKDTKKIAVDSPQRSKIPFETIDLSFHQYFSNYFLRGPPAPKT